MESLSKPSISFEFFPPKTAEGMSHLCEAAAVLAKLNPLFMSVTFGAGATTREGTIEAVQMLQRETGARIAPHLTCVGSTRADIDAILERYVALHVHRIVALRGDLPAGTEQAGELRYASELVKLIREKTGNHFHIEVAAYPEIHPQALSTNDDLMNLKRKYEAGADSAITQYFFNPDAYFYYLDECAALQINMPVIPGIMPITQFDRLVRFSDLCGADIPRWIKKRLESYQHDPASVAAFGLEVVSMLCRDLLAGGAPGLHFYTLNRADATCALMNELNLIRTPNKVATVMT